MQKRPRKQISRFISPLIFCVILGACEIEGAFASPEVGNLSFEKVKAVPLGSSQDKALAAFGRPSKIYREKLASYITWVYVAGSGEFDRYQKLGLTFSAEDFKLIAISYFPEPPDRITVFAGLMSEFPTAKFRTVRPSSCGEHFTVNEGFEYDPSAGIRIHKDSADRVTDLYISVPASDEKRKAASEPTGCPNKNERKAELIEITPLLK